VSGAPPHPSQHVSPRKEDSPTVLDHRLGMLLDRRLSVRQVCLISLACDGRSGEILFKGGGAKRPRRWSAGFNFRLILCAGRARFAVFSSQTPRSGMAASPTLLKGATSPSPATKPSAPPPAATEPTAPATEPSAPPPAAFSLFISLESTASWLHRPDLALDQLRRHGINGISKEAGSLVGLSRRSTPRTPLNRQGSPGASTRTQSQPQRPRLKQFRVKGLDMHVQIFNAKLF